MAVRFVWPSFKHAVHCVLMIFWISYFVYQSFANNANATDSPLESYGLYTGIVLIIVRLTSLLAFPQTLLNAISLTIFECFQDEVHLKGHISVKDTNFFIVRVVTRGLYPRLVQKTVSRNLETLESVGCENFAIEVVTDTELNLPVFDNNQRIREIVVPSDYRTPTGALNKSRALQYCWEETVNLLSDDEWVVHLDEETLLTENSVRGIINFIQDGRHAVGQGMITYAHEQPNFKSWATFLQNRICTVADSFRVTEDLGKIRGQFRLWHRPLFGMKGSYVVTNVGCERKVSFDNGLEGSTAEDAYFAISAMDKGYSFDFIEGAISDIFPRN